MNNILLILGIIALSNGNISLGDLPLFNNRGKSNTERVVKRKVKNSIDTTERRERGGVKKIVKKRRVKKGDESGENIFNFNIEDINRGMRLMDLSEEDLERGIEIITRTKKYMSKDEKQFLVKVESLLDLVRGIKKLSTVGDLEEEETNFFRTMDDEDKKNMMIKEILEVFPEKKKESIEKAIDMKKKIDLFAELFLPDDFGEGGFSISSLANISNLGSMSNLKLLGNLLRDDSGESNNSKEDEYEYYEYYEEEDDFENEKYNDDYINYSYDDDYEE